MSHYASPEALARAACAVARAFAPQPEMQGPPTPLPRPSLDKWRKPGTRRVRPALPACQRWAAK